MAMFVVLRWWVWIAVAIAGLVAGFVVRRLLERRRSSGRALRRQVAAASIVPSLILTVTAAGMLSVFRNYPAGGWNDLAIAAVMAMGGGLSLVAFVAGMVGAWLGRRGATE